MAITSYERVKMALNHQEPDRVPFDIGGAAVTGININTLRELRSYFGLPNENTQLDDIVIQTGKMDDDLIKAMGIDVKMVKPLPPTNPNLAKPLTMKGPDQYLVDEFGLGWRMPPEGYFFDFCDSPLADMEDPEEIYNYSWPKGDDPGRFLHMKEDVRRIVHEEKLGFMLERMNAGMWENAMWMTTYEKFFCDMITDPDMVEATMECFLKVKMDYWGKALEEAGDDTLVVSLADDIGTQTSLLVSMDSYKKLIWPYHCRLIEFIKSKKPDVHIFFHCDGAMKPAIPLLMEAGVDVLNPVQVNCTGMDDTKALKREFGDHLSFWGALCDTQKVLPYGTPEEVREETKRRVDDLAPGGGWIAAPIHIIQAHVPAENIVAMWETLREYGKK